MENNETQVVFCECGYYGHQLIFTTFEEDDEDVAISVHLSPLPFWKRLKTAVKYLFNASGGNGHFEEIITTKDKLKQVLSKI